MHYPTSRIITIATLNFWGLRHLGFPIAHLRQCNHGQRNVRNKFNAYGAFLDGQETPDETLGRSTTCQAYNVEVGEATRTVRPGLATELEIDGYIEASDLALSL